jgi:hypothetical protein
VKFGVSERMLAPETYRDFDGRSRDSLVEEIMWLRAARMRAYYDALTAQEYLERCSAMLRRIAPPDRATLEHELAVARGAAE